MKITVNNSAFHNAFHQANRGNQFSYEALDLIFDHLEDLEREMDEEFELDVVAICCEYAEAELKDLVEYYPGILDNIEDLADEEGIIDNLRSETTVLGTTSKGTIVYMQY